MMEEYEGKLIRSGAKVAACVPYNAKNPRKLEWIMAVVSKVTKDGYIVQDMFPENRKQSTWQVPPNKVVEFPDLNPKFVAGDRVLALWYLPDVEEWSSMFYEATVVETPRDPKAVQVNVRFRGDDRPSLIQMDKVVHMPPREGSSRSSKKRRKEPSAMELKMEMEEALSRAQSRA
eukprot:tig00021357_g20746.t1